MKSVVEEEEWTPVKIVRSVCIDLYCGTPQVSILVGAAFPFQVWLNDEEEMPFPHFYRPMFSVVI